MRDYQSLPHTTWDCKYHIVFIPKKKEDYGEIEEFHG
ncbi:putative transposase [Nitrosomonas communis]|uniref:Putative transposase n=1 Tax=Nitrosomonas communis TaxID=44574 RepID=A0A5D3YDB7_9PROT|nr:putative transposase [Nitrosomonas communis]